MIHTIDNPKLVKTFYYNQDDGFTGVLQDQYGDIGYFLDGKAHREDGPAVINKNGSVVYLRHGIRHREDGPALILKLIGRSGNFVQYFINGILLNVASDEELERYIKLSIFE